MNATFFIEEAKSMAKRFGVKILDLKVQDSEGVSRTRAIIEKDRRALKIQKRRGDLSCNICPPNRGENSKRKPKHGVSKPKKKDHRK